MAINKRSAEESPEKKELLLEVCAYLSSEEGQEVLIDGGPQISGVKGVTMEDSDFSAAIRDTIQNGRVINTFYLAAGENSKQVEKQLRSTVPDLVQGNISVEEWLLGADRVRDEFLAGDTTEVTVYGQTETTLTRLESAYTMAEMYKDLTGADIGICSGGVWRNGTNGHFYAGDITDTSLACVRPDKESAADDADPMTGTIVTDTMTGAQILALLNDAETSSGATEGESHYYVAAGLTVQFDPWADQGSRVLSCQLPDGTELDPEGSYQVAYFYGSLPDEFADAPERSLGQSWLDSFLTWLDEQGGVVRPPEMTLELIYN
jgi:raffinose/stachyose/melibiose transport system substrate-binding protein